MLPQKRPIFGSAFVVLADGMSLSKNEVPAGLLYAKNHEWVQVKEDGTLRVGITHYAQRELGDVVYLDIPTDRRSIGRGEPFGTVEAVKAVSDLFMPVSGTIIAVNEQLEHQPELVNRAPYDGGWMVEVSPSDRQELKALLRAEEYEKII